MGMKPKVADFLLCSNCFQDQGLKLDAEQIGIIEDSICTSCGDRIGRKLNRDLIAALAYRFFVWGSLDRCEYGAAPIVQFNEHQVTDIDTSPWFEPDIHLIENAIGVGFFYYGPRLWMIGEVEPLKALKRPATRQPIISRILDEYPTTVLEKEGIFYRVRKNPAEPTKFGTYDSPPVSLAGSGRFDSKGFPAMYGSQDLPVCIHESRITAEDDIYAATLTPRRDLRLLDLTELLQEENVTEFESLDMAIHMLFLAGKHSYEIIREIALACHAAGYDGCVFPSYFSLLRTGGMPFETTYGISNRRFPQLADREKSKIIRNLALFGRPVEQELVDVRCINKVILSQVEYGIHFGPVGC